MGLCMGLSFVSVFEVIIIIRYRFSYKRLLHIGTKVLVFAFQWIRYCSFFMTEAKSK